MTFRFRSPDLRKWRIGRWFADLPHSEVGDRRLRRWFAWYPMIVVDSEKEYCWLETVTLCEIREAASWEIESALTANPNELAAYRFLHPFFGSDTDPTDRLIWMRKTESEWKRITVLSSGSTDQSEPQESNQ
jgi:hypothetical protein